MKKIFIIVALVVINIFLVFTMIKDYHRIQFLSYPTVDIIGYDEQKITVDREKMTKQLTALADEHHSLIARRIVQPNKMNDIVFMYHLYGHQSVPEGIIQAPNDIVQQSDLINSYLIIGGTLDSQTLLMKLQELGYRCAVFPKLTLLEQVGHVVISPMFLLSFIVLCVTFSALILIEKIKDLRYASIRLVSGENILRIMSRSFINDILLMGSTLLILVIIDSIVFTMCHQIPVTQIILTMTTLFIVILIFLMISILLSVIYLLSLTKKSLKSLIKGKLPIRRLLSIMLLGQLISILIIAGTLNEAYKQFNYYHSLSSGRAEWQKNQQLVQLNMSMGEGLLSDKESNQHIETWYQFSKELIQQNKAILVYHKLRQSKLAFNSQDKNSINNNVIYVTPNYLQSQHIKVDKRFQNLKEGQFGLLLPNNFKSQASQYIDHFTMLMNRYAKADVESNSSQLFNMIPIVDYMPSHQQRFIYNLDNATIETQYLLDPIIIVITPTSMGQTLPSQLFWSTVIGNSLLINNYDDAVSMLKQYHVYSWVAYILNGNIKYLSNLAQLKIQLVTLFIGIVMTIVTSLLLFISMNILYFNKFRKDIFIKYISGMMTIEIHYRYLMTQLSTLFISLMLMIFFGVLNVIIFITSIIYIFLMSMIFYVQIKSEKKMTMTILKGQ